MVLFLVLLLNALACSLAVDDPIVTLPEGKISGVVATSGRYNKTYYGFMGIPFADKPIGKLRFQPPQLPQKWDGILETKSNWRKCLQLDADNTNAAEDCLYLNVYTPVKPGSPANLSVYVSIYGGAFLNGFTFPGTQAPQYIMEKGGIVVVSFNYRVGAFGFLSTGDTVVPGNMGLKDQTFALQWVQRNIHLFGGDPTKVTLAGGSAGSVSVTLQVLSPMAKGLFRGAIGESGSALIPWANVKNSVDTAYTLASLIHPGFSKSNSTAELRDVLLKANSDDITTILNSHEMFEFGPVIEPVHSGAFLTESFYDALANGRFNRVPILMGFNTEEMLYLAYNMTDVKETARNYDESPDLLVDDDMNIKDQKVKKEIANQIKNVYVGNGTFSENLGKTIQYNSDNTFTRPITRFAELYSAYEKVYFYRFSYHGELGHNPLYVPGAERVTHGEELCYFWACSYTLDGAVKADVRTLDRWVTLQTNFIKELNPTPEKTILFQYAIWQPMKPELLNFLDVNEDLSIRGNPRITYNFWKNIYEKYAQPPRITY